MAVTYKPFSEQQLRQLRSNRRIVIRLNSEVFFGVSLETGRRLESLIYFLRPTFDEFEDPQFGLGDRVASAKKGHLNDAIINQVMVDQEKGFSVVFNVNTAKQVLELVQSAFFGSEYATWCELLSYVWLMDPDSAKALLQRTIAKDEGYFPFAHDTLTMHFVRELNDSRTNKSFLRLRERLVINSENNIRRFRE